MVLGGAWSWGVPGKEPPVATAVGGMHPTGMHSCCPLNFKTRTFLVLN